MVDRLLHIFHNTYLPITYYNTYYNIYYLHIIYIYISYFIIPKFCEQMSTPLRYKETKLFYRTKFQYSIFKFLVLILVFLQCYLFNWKLNYCNQFHVNKNLNLKAVIQYWGPVAFRYSLSLF